MSKGRTKRLRVKAIKFAQLIATGSSQVNAWREVNPDWERIELSKQHEHAYRFAQHPIVAGEVSKALQNLAASAYMSVGQYAARVAQRADMLISENATAAAAYDRLLGQTVSALRENITLDDKSAPLQQLVDKLTRAGMDRRIAMRLLGVVDATEQPADAANVSQLSQRTQAK